MLKIAKEKVERDLRRLPVNKLQILSSILSLKGSPVFLNSSLISNATGATANQLGGQVSSIARTTIDDKPLFYPIGNIKPFDSITWRLNEEDFPKDELKEAVDSILIDIQKWQKRMSK